MKQTKPRFIAIEGPIGVGKSTLAGMLAQELDARLLLEVVDENPFLAKFYDDRRRYAFQTQLFFLLSRYRQQSEVFQGDLFSRGGVVSDYLLLKDRLFAALTLGDDELMLYDKLWEIIGPRAPKPDLVILLMARLDVLLERIKRRGRAYEKYFDRGYLGDVCRLYTEHFFEYSDAPLLIVDTSEIDFVHSRAAQEQLIQTIREHRGGIQHYRPIPDARWPENEVSAS